MSSRNILKINYIYHKIFGDHKLGNLGLDFSDKPKRQFIVQDIINRKNFKSYLEIGCFDNELFNTVKCDKKVGVDPEKYGVWDEQLDGVQSVAREMFVLPLVNAVKELAQRVEELEN